jgi:hypothetical protein
MQRALPFEAAVALTQRALPFEAVVALMQRALPFEAAVAGTVAARGKAHFRTAYGVCALSNTADATLSHVPPPFGSTATRSR